RFAKRDLVRIHDAQVHEAEVAHGAGGGADVQRIARRNQDDAQAVRLGCRQQVPILRVGLTLRNGKLHQKYTLGVFRFRPGIRLHLTGPLEKAREILAFVPDEFPELEEADLFHLHPGVGLDPPAQIGAAPRGEMVSARGIPQESQGVFHPIRERSLPEYSGRTASGTGAGSTETDARIEGFEARCERIWPTKRPASLQKTITTRRSTWWPRASRSARSKSTASRSRPTRDLPRPCTGWRGHCRICSATMRRSKWRSGLRSLIPMTCSRTPVCRCSIRKKE